MIAQITTQDLKREPKLTVSDIGKWCIWEGGLISMIGPEEEIKKRWEWMHNKDVNVPKELFME